MTPQESKSAGKGTEPHITVEWLSHFAQLCKQSKVRYEGSYELPFCDEWFSLPSNDYNPGLAVASMGLCLSGYKNLPSNGYKYILGSYEAFGFEDVDITSFYHLNDENYIAALDDVNVISYALGHRMVEAGGKKVPLVIVLVRGTSVSIEWNSNSDVANSVADGDYDIEYHEGFKKSADKCYDGAMAYIRKHGLDQEDARLWVVAHSRGATIANVVAAMFDECEECGFDKERIYAYTFASSPTTRRTDANGPAFDNIFNVMSPEDYIPRIPPTTWDFKRFGRDLFLPSVCTWYSAYREYYEEFLKRFKQWTRVDFPAFHCFEPTNAFDRSVLNISNDAADMYQHKRFSVAGTLTYAQYFRIFTDLAGHRGMALDKDAVKLGKYGVGPFDHFVAYFLRNEIGGHDAPGAHQEEGYLLKLMLCYEMGIDILAPALKEGADPTTYDAADYACDTRRFTVYGPVELIVRDGDGHIVAHIDDGRINEDVYEDARFISMHYDDLVGATEVWIPDSGDYEIELCSRKDASYDCTWDTQTPLGHVLTLDLYADVPFKKDERVKWSKIAPDAPTKSIGPDGAEKVDIEAHVAAKGSMARLGHDKALQSYYEHGDHIMPIPGPEVVADTLSARRATPGQHVFVEAYNGKDVRFVGWYPKDADPEKDKPLCKSKRYVFRAEESCELFAYFEVR